MTGRAAFLLVAVLAAGCGGEAASPTPVEFIPPVECIGIPAGTCQQIVTDARRNAQPGTFPVHIRAVCAQPPCTIQQGDVSVDIQYSDGRRDSYGMGWSGPGVEEPPPAQVELPVEPVCQGVPAGPCRDRAVEFVASSEDVRDIRSIVVRCTAASCTDVQGEGETLITFADGDVLTSSWGYAGGG